VKWRNRQHNDDHRRDDDDDDDEEEGSGSPRRRGDVTLVGEPVSASVFLSLFHRKIRSERLVSKSRNFVAGMA